MGRCKSGPFVIIRYFKDDKLLREGRFDEAELEVLDATVGKVLRYAAENLTNLPTFSLQALQGVLQAGRFVKDVALELQLDQVRTPEEYNQALAERFKKWDAAVQAAQNMSPEQIKDMACRFAADILTLEGLARAAEYARSSAVGSHGNAPVDGQAVKPIQKKVTVEAEGRSVTSQTAPRKEGAPTVRTERSRPASSVPVVTEETVVTVVTQEAGEKVGQAKKPVKLTAEEKAAQKLLKEKIRLAENQSKSKNSQKCKEHGMPTERGRHELPAEQKPAGWQDVVPGDRDHEILAKPFDYTRHTHVHPALPDAINANPKPIVINYEHITTPELNIKCSKGEISAGGFHHDYMGVIEKSGLIEIKDKAMLPNGCYKFEWKVPGAQWKESTLFPTEWTNAETVEKIYEALNNTTEIKYLGRDRYMHFGLTSEGIPVTSIIEINEKNAKLVTSYPEYIMSDNLTVGL